MSWMQEQFDRRYVKRPSKQLTALKSQVNSLESTVKALRSSLTALESAGAGQTHRVGRLTVPVLLPGATNTQTLTWSKPMPSSTYEVFVQQDPSIIGSVTTTVLSKTAESVQIRTSSARGISAAGQLLVTAWN